MVYVIMKRKWELLAAILFYYDINKIRDIVKSNC